MSRTWGMFSRMTGWSVRSAAAMQGSAAFFAPLTRTVPSSGSPPRITNLSMTRFIVAVEGAWVVNCWGTAGQGPADSPSVVQSPSDTRQDIGPGGDRVVVLGWDYLASNAVPT